MKKKVIEQKIEECCETGECCKDDCCKNESRTHGPSGDTVYGMGVVGAFVYFFPQITSISSFFMVLIKSIIWPGLLVYQALSLLKL